jgi:hypothetical protein
MRLMSVSKVQSNMMFVGRQSRRGLSAVERSRPAIAAVPAGVSGSMLPRLFQYVSTGSSASDTAVPRAPGNAWPPSGTSPGA